MLVVSSPSPVADYSPLQSLFLSDSSSKETSLLPAKAQPLGEGLRDLTPFSQIYISAVGFTSGTYEGM